MGVIIHLFNYHVATAKDWTIDQLVDFIRSVEPAEEPAGKTLAAMPEPEKVAEAVLA